jgi:adenosylcobinamide hydrolase
VTLTRSLVAGPAGPMLVVDLGQELRCISSAVLGGGLGRVRSWLNLQVPAGYARTDPERHLCEAARDVVPPVVGMMTAAAVAAVEDVARGSVRVFATVGLGRPLAAAGPAVVPRPEGPPPAGTINILAVVDMPLTETGLVGAVQTLVEAKAQALAAAGVQAPNAEGFATGTASDALLVACPLAVPGTAASPFCGPATAHGADLALAVFEAVRRGASGWLDHRRSNEVG